MKVLERILQWLYAKRVYLWGICLVTVIIFAASVQFFKDWLNAPGHEQAIILLLCLWIFSVLVFYLNGVAVTVYSRKAAQYGKVGKGIIIAFFSLLALFCCSIGLSLIFAFL